MKDLLNRGWLFAPDKDAAGGGKGDEKDKSPEGEAGKGDDKDKDAPTFETWFEGQSKDVKALVEAHESGLKSALGSERDARTEAEKSLRTMAKKAEEGSEAQTELTKVADSLAEETRKADFYAEAHDEGVTNLKLAYVVAVEEELIDKRGRVNFATMKEQFPELFGKAPRRPKGGAGEGGGDDLAPKPSMNTFIRTAAGRQPK